MCLHAPLPLLLGSLLYPPSKAWPSWLSTPTELTNQWRNYKSIAVLTLLNLRKKKESFLCEHTSFHWISWLSEKHQEKILSWPGCETSTPTLSPTPPPACTCQDRIQVWVVKAVSNNTRGGLMLNLKSLSRETHWGLDRISHLSLFRCWTFVWGLQSSIIHANASSSKQTTFTLCSDAD